MIRASRDLTLRREGASEFRMEVRIHAPEKADIDWMCRYDIDWPDGTVQRWGSGVDAVQALLSALQMIGSEFYASAAHREGRLTWTGDGRG